MVDDGRIILHVGVQKTGSTYLQMRLARNAKKLRDAGLYYPIVPVVDRLVGNAKLLATVLNGEPTRIFEFAFPALDVSRMDPAAEVARLLADWRPDRETLLLSAEIFRPERALQLRSLLPDWTKVTVVLFVRRQDLWVESYYSQCIKTGQFKGSIQTFLYELLSQRRADLCYPDWTVHLSAWRDAFQGCEVVLFDEVKDDLFGAFFRAAAHPEPAVDGLAPQQVALSLNQIAYLLAHEKDVAFADFMRRRAASQAAASTSDIGDLRSLLSPADISLLRERFAAANRRFLVELGRDESDPCLELTGSSKPYVTLDEIYASDEYRQHAVKADAIYARHQ